MIKILKYLQKATTRELNSLELFLQSPYFNTREDLIKLYQALRPAYPSFSGIEPNKLWEAVYPDQAFHPKALNKKFHELSVLVLQFLAQQQIQQDELLQSAIRRKAFRDRDLYVPFRKESDLVLARYEKSATKSAEALLQTWLVRHDIYRHPGTPITPDPFEQEVAALKALEEHCLLHQLMVHSDALSRPLKADSSWNTVPLDDILENANRISGQSQLIDLYRMTIELFKSGCTLEKFQVVVEILKRASESLAAEDQALLVIKLTNLAFQQVAKGKSPFIDVLFNLYQYGANKDLFRNKNLMANEDIFINICIAGAFAKEKTWVQAFIKQHRPFLPPATRKSTVLLGRIFLLFHSGEYDEAYQLIEKVQRTRNTYNLRTRSLIVRCLLERHLKKPSLYDSLRHEVLAFQKYLQRNKLLHDSRKKAYHAFSKMVLKMADLRRTDWESNVHRQALCDKIESETNINLKSWLLAKIPLLER